MIEPTDSNSLVCYPRAYADAHAELMAVCGEIAAGSCLLHPSHLAQLRSLVNRLHLMTSAEFAWPIPTPPTIPPTVPTSIPTTSSAS